MLEHESSTPEKITKEIRFAVVMYGGISLAIYMNGIAQELLSMVRATSPLEPDPEKLQGTTRVYRDIANYLSTHQNNGEFDHRFIVDIISGTSAGGINGICLAKALARGLGDLKTLEQTWYSEGDIDHLLNDKGSEPKKFRSKEPKTSLFNSQRMYGKLLEAFQKMESNAKNDKSHVDYIDLFVTATDLRGIQLPIVLEEGQDEEKIYKHVFPFAYRTDPSCHIRQVNHFSGRFDSMLAFAARCTSSIPPAFEPVTIRDIKQYLEEHSPADLKQWDNNLAINNDNNWQELFFGAYVGADTATNLDLRPFADGGYLDNRPFGHAIHSIHTREADCPISRKLLYIDPSPEKAEDARQFENISFIQNLALASVSLPRYETIRDEIEGIENRNEWIKSANYILKEMLDQNDQKLKSIVFNHFLDYFQQTENISLKIEDHSLIPLFYPFSPVDKKITIEKTNVHKVFSPKVKAFWEEYVAEKSIPARERETCSKNDSKDLMEMVTMLGSSYTAYHYTRFNALTDEIALMFIKAMNASKQNFIRIVVKEIVRAWIQKHYHAIKDEKDKNIQTQNLFFRNYDIRFRIRRLNLFREKIEKAINKQSTKGLFFGLFELPQDAHDSTSDNQFKMTPDTENVLTIFYKGNNNTNGSLTESLRSLYRLRALLLSTGTQNPLHEQARQLRRSIEMVLKNNGCEAIRRELSFDEITAIFEKQSTPGATRPFRDIVMHLMETLHTLIKNGHTEQSGNDTIRYEGSIASSEKVDQALKRVCGFEPVIGGCMRYMYDYGYDLHDMTILPLLSGGEYGEGTPIDVFRTSPADATSLWDEQERQESKLAGVALGAFGAFLDDEWRRNDIMWGRLDAAERIINILLPEKKDKDMRDISIRRAQFAIINETTSEWIGKKLDEKRFYSSETRAYDQYKRIKSIHDEIIKTPDYDGIAENPQWKEAFCHQYNFNRKIDPPPNLKRLGRGSAILSSMIQGLDEKSGPFEKVSDTLKKLSWILLGLLDFSTPKSFKAIAAHYGLQLVLLTSALMIIMGLFFGGVDVLKDTANTLYWSGIVLAVLDISALLLQYKMTEVIYEKEQTFSFPYIIKGILTGLLVIILIKYVTIPYRIDEVLKKIPEIWPTLVQTFESMSKSDTNIMHGK